MDARLLFIFAVFFMLHTANSAKPCTADDEDCTIKCQCCSKNCVNGKCVKLCAERGTACSSPSECCSNVCESNACTAQPDCRTTGTICQNDGQCCKGTCSYEVAKKIGIVDNVGVCYDETFN